LLPAAQLALQEVAGIVAGGPQSALREEPCGYDHRADVESEEGDCFGDGEGYSSRLAPYRPFDHAGYVSACVGWGTHGVLLGKGKPQQTEGIVVGNDMGVP